MMVDAGSQVLLRVLQLLLLFFVVGPESTHALKLSTG